MPINTIEIFQLFSHAHEKMLTFEVFYVDDNIQTNVAFTVSECKTLGHYAEKQTAKYGKYEVEDMRANFKTKQVEPAKELPEGMSRMERPKESTAWTRESKKRRKVNR